MPSLNKVILMGNLTRDPEVRHTESGTAVADMSLAISERYEGRNGEKNETVVFVDIVVWNKQAEACGEFLRKGSAALVEGRLQLDQWVTNEGEKRNRLRVRGDRVQFVGAPARPVNGSGGNGGGSGGNGGGNGGGEGRAEPRGGGKSDRRPASARAD